MRYLSTVSSLPHDILSPFASETHLHSKNSSRPLESDLEFPIITVNDVSRHTFPHPGNNDVINVTLQRPSFLRISKSEYNPDANSIRCVLLFRRRSNQFGGSLAGNVNDEEKTWGLEFEAGSR